MIVNVDGTISDRFDISRLSFGGADNWSSNGYFGERFDSMLRSSIYDKRTTVLFYPEKGADVGDIHFLINLVKKPKNDDSSLGKIVRHQEKYPDPFLITPSLSHVSSEVAEHYEQMIDHSKLTLTDIYWKAFKLLCHENGIHLTKEQQRTRLSREDRVILYIYPLIRNELWNPEVTFFNLHSASSMPDFLLADNFKDFVYESTGVKSAKMLKMIGSIIYRKYYRHFRRYDMYSQGITNSSFSSFRDNGYFEAESTQYERSTDIVTTFCKTEIDLYTLQMVSELRKLLPIDYVYRILEEIGAKETGANIPFGAPFSSDYELEYQQMPTANCVIYQHDVIDFFKKRYPPKTLYKFYKERCYGYGYLSDIKRQYEAYRDPSSIPDILKGKYPNGLVYPKRVQSLQELHDKISIQYREIKAEADNKHIEYSDEELVLDGYEEGEFKFILPKRTIEMVKWGGEMKNCIASYADSAVNKSCMIVGVEIDGELTYNIEVGFVIFNETDDFLGCLRCENDPKPKIIKTCRRPDIRQFRGKSNSKPNQYHEQKISQIIMDKLKDGMNSGDIKQVS